MKKHLLILTLLFCSFSFAQKVVSDSIKNNMLDEVVVAASRTPEKVMQSPVTIERMGLKDIKKTASPSYYDGLEDLKEVQMNTSSLTFKSINTRGFATVANVRFMQLVDGMDNSSPLLNFVLGNMIGISEIDVQSVELLPGASSALYGANAFNGILFMNSKNPFTSEGVNGYVKYGQTSQQAAGVNSFTDYGVRVAHKFNNYFAAKANYTYMKGTDWYATNYNGIDALTGDEIKGIDRTNPSYNGINVYGDEVSVNLASKAPASLVASIPSLNTVVSRTGYKEIDLTDNKASNTKLDFSIHLRPFGNENLEVIWQSKFGFGNAVYQGANRYYLNNFFMQQHKLEFKGKNFFVRGYTTTEDGGNSYDMLFTGININREWKSDAAWFTEYIQKYAGAYSGAVPGLAPGNIVASHAFARSQADIGRLIPGSDAFKAKFNKVTSEASVLSGSKLVDNSRIYHSDANYNLKDVIKFAEIQVGGSYRLYELNSNGRIYTDANGIINYNEYGAYTQLTKKVMEDRLKLSGSIRYDKSKNFEGNYSPRISAVYSAGDKKQHNFRASFQTGFRNPSTQDQYIGFNVGSALLLGSAPDNLTRISEVFPITSTNGIAFAGGATSVTMNGLNAYNNSYTATSLADYSNRLKGPLLTINGVLETPLERDRAARELIKKTNLNYVKPEEVKAIELGYRSVMGKTSIDVNGYYNSYKNFIGNVDVAAPYYGVVRDNPSSTGGAVDTGFKSLYALSVGDYRAYKLYANTDVEIKSFGFGLGLSRKVIREFEVGVNYNYAEFNFDATNSNDKGFEANFNTPKHRVKASIGNEKLFKNFGFNVSGRWNTEYIWESTMVDGVIPEATVFDAQINYNVESMKSTFKIGAANLGGKEYFQVLGAGLIGQQIFASWTIKP
jgi:outer membrane receptor protein involved in Fe transport